MANFIRLGALLGFLGVAAGAFGAHLLRAKLSSDMMAIYETASRYQLIHSLALVMVGILRMLRPGAVALSVSGWAFFSGTIVFSGSLYLLALSGVRLLGAVTPFGGLALLFGWVALFVFALKSHY